jgi:hypothetical protein
MPMCLVRLSSWGTAVVPRFWCKRCISVAVNFNINNLIAKTLLFARIAGQKKLRIVKERVSLWHSEMK